ncbi:hypothetical protein BDN72DRAFT_816731 [Pluteus cervinus]|uniref:Uncharacterized protein n=1 Tax=Pluteus cervinus TaxID=181527 RepID=A0ACD3B2N6_9AGAR|nr:hypothetical protein BDN72DRAFT_816731 [Pluteus cervinus]
MAVPESLTTRDLSAVYVLNKALTPGDKTDEILRLQGVGWLTRKAINLATVTLYVKHYSEDSLEHIDIDQALTGGIGASAELRVLDWTKREKEDRIFGHVLSKSRRIQVNELGEGYLKKGWTEDTVQNGLIQSYVESDTPKSHTTWAANQTWGIEVIQGERRYTRHVHFSAGKEVIEVTMVYDYFGPWPAQSI